MDSSVQSITALFQCKSCRKPFTDPRVLPTCLHTFCFDCIETCLACEGEDGNRHCPDCKKPFPVPEDGASGFPKDIFLGYYMEAFIDEGNTDLDYAKWIDMRCCNAEDEDECPSPEQFCVECGEYYCNDCCRVHLKATKKRKGKSHEMLKKDNLTPESLAKSLIKSQIPRCLDHKKKLKFYCSTCHRPGCSICCLAHKGHELEQITNGDETKKRVLQKRMTKIQSVIDDREAQKEKCARKKEENATAILSAAEKAQNVFAMVSRLLEEQAEQTEQSLTFHVGELQRLHSFMECLVDTGSVINRLANYPGISPRLRHISSSLVDRNQEAPLASLGGTLAQQLKDLTLEGDINLDDSGDGETDRVLKIKLHFQLQQGTKNKETKQTRREDEEEDAEEETTAGYESIEIEDDDSDDADGDSDDFSVDSKFFQEDQEGETASLYQHLTITGEDRKVDSSVPQNVKFQRHASRRMARLETSSDPLSLESNRELLEAANSAGHELVGTSLRQSQKLRQKKLLGPDKSLVPKKEYFYDGLLGTAVSPSQI